MLVHDGFETGAVLTPPSSGSHGLGFRVVTGEGRTGGRRQAAVRPGCRTPVAAPGPQSMSCRFHCVCQLPPPPAIHDQSHPDDPLDGDACLHLTVCI